MKYVVIAIFYLLLLGCGDPHADHGFKETYIVATTEDLKVLGAIHVSKEMEKVTIVQKDPSNQIAGFVVGPGKHQGIKPNIYMVTIESEYSLRRIEFELSDGIVESIYANGMSSGLKITETMRKDILRMAESDLDDDLFKIENNSEPNK